MLDPLEEGDRSIGCTMEEMVLPSVMAQMERLSFVGPQRVG